jgi:hypothetical protein
MSTEIVRFRLFSYGKSYPQKREFPLVFHRVLCGKVGGKGAKPSGQSGKYRGIMSTLASVSIFSNLLFFPIFFFFSKLFARLLFLSLFRSLFHL